MPTDADKGPTEAINTDPNSVSRTDKKREKKKKRKKNNHDNGAASSSKRRKVDSSVDGPRVNNTVVTSGEKPEDSIPVKKKNKKKKKKDRRVKNLTSSASGKEGLTAVEPVEQEETGDSETTFPYPTDPDDHCESPLQAYAHIQPLLQLLQSNGTQKELQIYDPYYCNGAVVENLAALGFPSVYNKKEDCYETWVSSSAYPEYDVFLTNPPYSGDHIEKLVKHLTSSKLGNRPWFLLMPDWVHKKDYFVSEMKRKQIQPFYLVPKKRYVYLPPKNYRAAKKSDVHKKSSPFNSMWYVWGGTKEQNDRLIQAYYSKKGCLFPVVDSGSKTGVEGATKVALADACDLARSKSALRDLRRKVKKK